MNCKFKISFMMYLTCTILLTLPCFSQNVDVEKSIDEKVKNLLESRKGEWRDRNVPETDGKELYNLIIKNKYKKALEIGTSTGHSGIWIGWALSKTGGKLITIEMNDNRHFLNECSQALAWEHGPKCKRYCVWNLRNVQWHV